MKFRHGLSCASDRRGISIVELMIAITISLIVLVVMMKAFQRASGEIKKGRAMIEMASEMRAVGETFRRDMANATVSPRVWNLNSECNGYFEIVEGLQNDGTYPGLGTDAVDNDGDAAIDEPDEAQMSVSYGFMGDMDDVVALTVRSGEKPFRGRWMDPLDPPGSPPKIVESHVAEIVWFVVRQDIDEVNGIMDLDDRVTLYRRVLLVRPDLALQGTSANMTAYYLDNDISARPVGVNLAANTLSDLTLRENRYCHDPDPLAFPHALQNSPPNTWLQDRRLATGEDILLTNVAGFDVRVYSPNALTKTPNDSQFLGPNDPNFVANTDPTAVEGSYLDLGWGGVYDGVDNDGDTLVDEPDEASSANWFSVQLNAPTGVERTWCSWSPHYEYNGIDDDDDGQIDEGTNGLDDNGNGMVDEETEQDAPAPYAHPLRAVQMTMRGIEKSTRNIRQVTITSSFVPE